MPTIDKLAADNAVLILNVNALLTAAQVVVTDGTAGTSQPHLDTLAATILTVAATRARMTRLGDSL